MNSDNNTKIENGSTAIEESDSSQTIKEENNLNDFPQSGNINTIADNDHPDASQEVINQAASSKTRSYLKYLVLVFIPILIVILSLLFYKKLYLSPERITSNMFDTMQNVRTLTYSGSANIELSGDGINEEADLSTESKDIYNIFSDKLLSNYKIDFEGVYDSYLSNVAKYSLNLKLYSGSIPILDIESIKMVDIYYIKINKLQAFDLVDDSLYLGEWIKVDPKKLQEDYDVSFNSKQINSSTQQRSGLVNLIQNNPPFTSIENIADENSINKYYHFKYKIDNKNLTDILARIIYLYSGNNLTVDEVGKLNKSVNNILFDDLESWIGKKDNLLYKLQAKVIASPEKVNGISTNANLALEFNGFNEKVSVVEPNNYKTLESIIKEINDVVRYVPVEENVNSDVPQLQQSFNYDQIIGLINRLGDDINSMVSGVSTASGIIKR